MNSTKKILIIDDDARNIFALTAILQSVGFDCISASGAVEGSNMLTPESDIGIILLDMMMPEMDGYEAMPYLRKLSGFKAIPIIAVTAQAMPADRQKCIDAGATEYISKPIDVDKLVKMIERFL